ncbi:hypothetical protein [Mesorhizobium sp.]|uniref:hypothetical protein n=1 Tax=Mesorhizobium sp. TaxID=1871066 RepID=UPI000FE301EB|nr:hypothetical protein [Mesorhizobium sp.]RWN92549.1 MAG: hypothetical protein EOS06_32495 [Mesorhizobium sp.]TJU73272.1 MAG: hypothetical protein E5Y15_32985 [Mesorhizobium sp.]
MNEANANRTVIDLGRSIAHACIRDRPKQELTFPFSFLTLENYSANRPTPRVSARSIQRGRSFTAPAVLLDEMNSEVLVDAAEGGDVLPGFRRAFVMPKRLTSIPPAPGAHEAMFRYKVSPPLRFASR